MDCLGCGSRVVRPDRCYPLIYTLICVRRRHYASARLRTVEAGTLPCGSVEGRHTVMSERDRKKEGVPHECKTVAQATEVATEAQRDQTDDALQSFADGIQEKTGAVPGSDRTIDAGAIATEQIERVGDTGRRRARQIAGEARSVMRRQPVVAAAVGVAIGFVIGRLSK